MPTARQMLLALDEESLRFILDDWDTLNEYRGNTTITTNQMVELLLKDSPTLESLLYTLMPDTIRAIARNLNTHPLADCIYATLYSRVASKDVHDDMSR